MQFESNQLEKTMQNRHLSVSQFSEPNSLQRNSSRVEAPGSNDLPQFEGYLFKRNSKGFKTWNRRWFYLRDNQLLYVYDSRNKKKQTSALEKTIIYKIILLYFQKT